MAMIYSTTAMCKSVNNKLNDAMQYVPVAYSLQLQHYNLKIRVDNCNDITNNKSLPIKK